ncbi:acetylcholinesterase-like [Haemaphysalis longicornis]
MWRKILIALSLLSGSRCTQDTVERQTKLGWVVGLKLNVLNAKIEQYLGIPYAEPPLGAKRFRASIPATPWNGTIDATARRTACPQPGFSGLSPTGINYTEDCLHLNVWTPEPEENETVERLPVVVWIHGGGFKYSSSSNPRYNGSILSAKAGLVVVSMNYRLGVLGFLDASSVEAPGNMGLMDQILALKWVQENAEFFGGDPFKVTLFGQSAGAMCVHAHLLSPLSKDLFWNAMLLSGSLYSIDLFDSPQQSLQKGDRVSTILNCSYNDWNLSTHADGVISCLRNKSVQELISASLEAVAPKFVPFFPSYHNDFLPKDPRTATERGLFQQVSVVLGLTSDEMCWALARSTRGRLLLGDIESENATSIRQVLERAMENQMREIPPSTLAHYLENVTTSSNTALVRQYLDYLSDRMFNCPVHFLARHLAARGNKVFSYVFDHNYDSPELPTWVGTPHTGELFFLFGHPLANASHLGDEHYNISEAFMRILSSFAFTGNPELPTGRQWPLYTENNPVSVVLAPGNYSDVHGFRATECEFWTPFFQPSLVA